MAEVRALGLISGGLDSILAALLLRKTGVEIAGLCLTTPFFGAEKAREAAQLYHIPLTVLPADAEHLETVVKNPRYGYGSNMNPCIDCHAYMLRKAGQILETQGFDFLFTGEVLGQRPMSQNANALNAVAKFSGYGQLVLRPLSARLLSPTPMEEQGLVSRESLGAISGRGRKQQMELANALGAHHYPAPGGGCLLTDPGFSGRLRDLLDHKPDCGPVDAELLKYGRHFRLGAQAKLIVGRHQADNAALNELLKKGAPGLRLHIASGPGPVAVYMGTDEDIPLACAIVAAYGAKGSGQVAVKAGEKTCLVAPLSKMRTQEFMI